MATFWQTAGGVRGLIFEGEPNKTVPVGASSVSFDETTNQAIVDSMSGRVAGVKFDDHTISGAQILIKGIAATIQPDSTDIADRKALLAAAANAITTNQTFIALASPTNAQVIAQVKALSQQNNHLIRRILQLTR